MSWLSGLAGKAEDLLNKIDQNAAIALQKDSAPQFRAKDAVVVEVSGDGGTSLPPSRPTVSTKNYGVQPIRQSTANFVPIVKSYSNISAAVGSGSIKDSTSKTLHSGDEDELIRFLNSPSMEAGKSKKVASFSVGSVNYNGISASSSPKQKPLSRVTSPKRESSLESGGSYNLIPKKDEVAVEVSEVEDSSLNEVLEVGDSVNSLSEENGVLKRELQSTEQEANLLRRKLKESQKEMELLQETLNNAEDRLKEAQEMYAAAVEDNKKFTEAASMEHFKTQTELDRLRNELSQSMDDKTRALEALKDKMESEVAAARSRNSSLQNRYDSLMEELRNERLEQERYRARAQAVLAGRDREIAELRGKKDNAQEVDDEGSEFRELESENERHRWEEEIFHLREQVANLKAALDEGRHQWDKDREIAEDELIMERGRREASEEETKAALEELRSTRDEVMKLRQVEMELRQKTGKLRKAEEVKTGSNPPRDSWVGGRVPTAGESVRDAVEDSLSSRLSALTSTLVEKQVRVESLTAERNALRLQLEKTDHLYRDALTHLGQVPNGSLAGQNDTDDVKARIPSFLLESPFDTAVARRVKRAYSSLDAVGVRFGIFLRRYPLARTLLLSYTVLLHLWVVVVLLTYTPDAH